VVMSTLPTNWNPNHAPTAAELAQVIAAIKLAQDPPCCIVRRSSAQSINNTTFTDVSFNTEVVDNANMFTPTSTTITIRYDGYYLITVGSNWASSATGIRVHLPLLNGVVIDGIEWENPSSAAADTRFTTGNMISAVAGDTVGVQVWQNTGGAFNLDNMRVGVVRVSGPGT
jgi:hypothetical protein